MQIIAGVTFSFGDLVANSYAASRYGLSLLWTRLLSSFIIVVLLQSSSNLGLFIGKGLIEAIRDFYGIRLSVLCSSMIFVNIIATVTAEIAAASVILEFFTNISCKFWAPLIALTLCIVAIYSSSVKLRIVMSSISFLVVLVIPVALTYGVNDVKAVFNGLFTISPILSRDWIITVMALIGSAVGSNIILFEMNEASKDTDNLTSLSSRYHGFLVGSIENFILSLSLMLICAGQLYSRGEVVSSINDILSALLPKLGFICTLLFVCGVLISFYLCCSVSVVSNFKLLEELISNIAEIAKIRYAILSGWKVLLASSSILLGAFMVIFNINIVKLSLYASSISAFTLPIPLFFLAKLHDKLKFPVKMNSMILKFLKFVHWFLLCFLSILSIGGLITSLI